MCFERIAIVRPGVILIRHLTKILQILNQAISREVLARYFPVQAVSHIENAVSGFRIRLKITRGRASKLGDFKPSMNGGLHQISVNADLNIYAFLLVFAHELAHLMVFERSGNSVRPHGKEWKKQFGELIRTYIEQGFFHPVLHESLIRYSCHVRASGIASEPVVRDLAVFDHGGGSDGPLLLEDIPEEALFLTRTGRLFKKEGRLRKRYRCLCLDNQRTYLFHPMAKVNRAERPPSMNNANLRMKQMKHKKI